MIFDQPLKADLIPNLVKHLTFDDHSYKSMEEWFIPNSFTYLTIDWIIDKSLKKEFFSIHLTLECDADKFLKERDIANYVTHLIIDCISW